MRSVLVALALLLMTAAAAGGRSTDDVRQLALHTVDTNVKDAVKLETDAVRLLKGGNLKGAEQEIRNSKDLLDGALGSAQALTPPSEADRWVPVTNSNSNWEGLAHTMRLAYGDDAAALLTNSTRSRIELLDHALALKRAILHLVDPEITHPQCSLLINRQGPVNVNGTAQGGGQLSVDVACAKRVTEVIVDTPHNTVTKTSADGGVQSIVGKSATVVELDLKGAKSGGVTMESTPDAAAGEPVDVIVVFAGSIEPFNETA